MIWLPPTHHVPFLTPLRCPLRSMTCTGRFGTTSDETSVKVCPTAQDEAHVILVPAVWAHCLAASEHHPAPNLQPNVFSLVGTSLGNFFGYVRVEPEGGVNLYYKWDDPFGGHCCDEMRLRGQDELHVTTHLTVGEAQCSYRVIYWRSGSSGSGMAPQPMTSPLTHLMRSASKVALQMQDALGMVDSRAVAQHALSQGGRKGSAGDLSSDGHISDTSDHGHRGSHERRNSTEGRPRRVRPFARVEEM